MTRHELTTEDRRRGAQRSAEVRRKRRERSWNDAFLELVDQAPDEVAGRLLASGNAMALVKAIELATAHTDIRLRRRAAELEQREAGVARREREAASTEDWLEMARRKRDRLLAQAEELERQRDELQVAIARDAEAHGYELVEDEDALAEA